jgi:hypothetical protein
MRSLEHPMTRMDDAPAGVFVLAVQATAGPDNADPDGRRYDLLVFARGDSDADAEVAARQGLAARGWTDARLIRSGEIVDAGAVPEDLRGAMQRAREAGCALIVYEQP